MELSDMSQPPQRSVMCDARSGVCTCYSTVADSRRNHARFACQAAAGVEEKLHFLLAVCCRPKLCEDWSIICWRLDLSIKFKLICSQIEKNNLNSIWSESFISVRILITLFNLSDLNIGSCSAEIVHMMKLEL